MYLRYVEPEGRKPNAHYRDPGTINIFGKKLYVFLRIRAYPRYIKPEGRKPTALEQNPDIFLINFNNFIQLLGHLGTTLGQVFVEIVEDQGRKVKNRPQKWHVDVEWHM